MRWLLPLCGLLLMPPWGLGVCRAEEGQASEYAVKAAFLLNFARFTEWPPKAFATTGAPIEICVMGSDPFGAMLDELVDSETVNGRKILVRRLKGPPAAQTCQILFVDSQLKNMRRALEGVESDALTISEGSRFIQEGGMIALVIENRRVRFDINQKAVEEHGLKLSSRLLSIARSVTR
jgi:hypothetical protein